MKILAFGTSNSRESINRTLATHVADLVAQGVDDAEIEILDIADYEMPLFSDEREQQLGQPMQARAFRKKIAGADALVISFTEHNGSYTAAWKNLFDWTSRIDRTVFQDKPSVYLATSPGPGGAASVLSQAINSAPYFGADVIANVSVPSFQKNFDPETQQITNPDIRRRLERAAGMLAEATLERAAAA